MNTTTILQLLKNSGFHGLRADAEFIYMEDPSCILRSFETFINYADRSQEGRHRMYVAAQLTSWDTKFPVMVVDVYDKDDILPIHLDSFEEIWIQGKQNYEKRTDSWRFKCSCYC